MPTDLPSLPFPADVAARAALARRPKAPLTQVLIQAQASQRWREGRALIGGKVSKVTTNVTLTTNVMKNAPGLHLDKEETRVKRAHGKKG